MNLIVFDKCGDEPRKESRDATDYRIESEIKTDIDLRDGFHNAVYREPHDPQADAHGDIQQST